MNFPLLVFVVSFAAFILSALIGEALRKRLRPLREDTRDDSGVVLTGTLTLLGLVIGFSFSMAITRYDLRKGYEQAEANAIAVEYTRADLLPASDALKVHQLLKAYLDQRVLFYTIRSQREVAQIDADTARLQNELWSAVRSGIAGVPPQREGLLVSGMNDVMVSQRSTQAAWWNRIPVSVWVMIVATSIGCNFLIGYRARQRDWLVFLVMPLAVSISLFLIADLDSPRGGAIRVIPHNLVSLSKSLHEQ